MAISKRPRFPGIVAAAFVATCLGCARNPDPVAPGPPGQPGSTPTSDPVQDAQPRTGEISFPRPDRETCVPRSRTPYVLSVRVRDDMGAGFPDVAVHLLPMGAGNEKLATSRTNRNGIADVIVNPAGVYAVGVAAGGFEPQIRPLTMRPGCSGFTTFTLKPGPVAK